MRLLSHNEVMFVRLGRLFLVSIGVVRGLDEVIRIGGVGYITGSAICHDREKMV